MCRGELEVASLLFRYGTEESEEMTRGAGQGESILEIQQEMKSAEKTLFPYLTTV